jgi:hypothetical protein
MSDGRGSRFPALSRVPSSLILHFIGGSLSPRSTGGRRSTRYSPVTTKRRRGRSKSGQSVQFLRATRRKPASATRITTSAMPKRHEHDPTRYRECLAVLGLSQRGLAPFLNCSEQSDPRLHGRQNGDPRARSQMAGEVGAQSPGASGRPAAKGLDPTRRVGAIGRVYGRGAHRGTSITARLPSLNNRHNIRHDAAAHCMDQRQWAPDEIPGGSEW